MASSIGTFRVEDEAIVVLKRRVASFERLSHAEHVLSTQASVEDELEHKRKTADGHNLGTGEDFTILEFRDGARYMGEWLDGKAHGIGIRSSADWEYHGLWVDGVQSGLGVYMWSDGSWYEGEWQGGLQHGMGVYVDAAGTEYAGCWFDGERARYGVCDYKEGYKYLGTWRSNFHDGYGVELYNGGGFYAGQWKGGHRWGLGKRQCDKADIAPGLESSWFSAAHEEVDAGMYAGDWARDVRNGFGVMRYTSGAVYAGGWENNQRHGYGELTDALGNLRRGKWRHGVLHVNILRTKEFWRRVREAADVAEYKAQQAEEAASAAKSQAARAEAMREMALDVQARARAVKDRTNTIVKRCMYLEELYPSKTKVPERIVPRAESSDAASLHSSDSKDKHNIDFWKEGRVYANAGEALHAQGEVLKIAPVPSTKDKVATVAYYVFVSVAVAFLALYLRSWGH